MAQAQPLPFSRTLPRTRWKRRVTRAMILGGAAILGIEPISWLVRSWYVPGYEGIGIWAFALVSGLVTASLCTPVRGSNPQTLKPIVLILVTALIRLAAQLLDINMLGALVLSVDVYALGCLARLDQRRFSLSPLWLAALFTFCLPIEPAVQRLVGYGLQQLSAGVSCGMLSMLASDVVCDGIRLQLSGQDVLVDLPCSGSQLLSLSLLLFALANSLRPPPALRAGFGLVLLLLLVLLLNALRITILAFGIAHESSLPFNIMEVHSAVGVVMVVVLAICLGAWSLRGPLRKSNTEKPPPWLPEVATPGRWLGLLFSLAFLVFATIIVGLHPRPVDATDPLPEPALPVYVAGWLEQPIALSDRELAYFTRHGGSAAKSSYGPYGLLVVSTSSPLRHLHDPALCLRGIADEVRFLTTEFSTVPTAVYRATRHGPGPEATYLIRISYLADDGQQASSISEVVWRWFQRPNSRWSMIQRVVPVDKDVNVDDAARWDRAIERAFNLT